MDVRHVVVPERRASVQVDGPVDRRQPAVVPLGDRGVRPRRAAPERMAACVLHRCLRRPDRLQGRPLGGRRGLRVDRRPGVAAFARGRRHAHLGSGRLARRRGRPLGRPDGHLPDRGPRLPAVRLGLPRDLERRPEAVRARRPGRAGRDRRSDVRPQRDGSAPRRARGRRRGSGTAPGRRRARPAASSVAAVAAPPVADRGRPGRPARSGRLGSVFGQG